MVLHIVFAFVRIRRSLKTVVVLMKPNTERRVSLERDERPSFTWVAGAGSGRRCPVTMLTFRFQTRHTA